MPALADAGFSQGVLNALPAASTRSVVWRRLGACIIGTALGLGVAVSLGLSWSELQSDWQRLLVAGSEARSLLIDPAITGAMVVTIGSLLYAYRFAIRDRVLEEI